MKKKIYQSPVMEVINVDAQEVLCASPTGSFTVSTNDIESGDEETSTWGNALDW